MKQMHDELKDLFDRCSVIVEYLTTKDPHGGELLKRGYSAAFKRKSLRELRMGYRALIDMTKQLSPHEQSELDMELRKRLGSGTQEAIRDLNDAATQAIRRGAIENEDEFYLLRNYFEEIWEDETKRDEADKISRLLSEFEKRKE
ncbi:MAG: hypothetical protein RBT76_09930 [candidate division Zixibacteria bacterium]|jgi:hypothetical protein|nr:hypothetical protein [candidate division Zixibacteria bacterium]